MAWHSGRTVLCGHGDRTRKGNWGSHHLANRRSHFRYQASQVWWLSRQAAPTVWPSALTVEYGPGVGTTRGSWEMGRPLTDTPQSGFLVQFSALASSTRFQLREAMNIAWRWQLTVAYGAGVRTTKVSWVLVQHRIASLLDWSS